MRLTAEQRQEYRRAGHLTVPGVFAPPEMDRASADIHEWGESFLAGLAPGQRRWYVDAGVTSREVLRKLDNPVFHRPVLRALATDPRLVGLVEDLIGAGLTILFSQIFFKPPHGGGPKPVHQDNFYFGPRDREAIVTAWIALDDADLENGCMSFGEGTHAGAVFAHVAPPGEPFNLRVPPEVAARVAMSPAPVPKGGVSFHHGTIFHQSADNNSSRWRRACAIHYFRNDNALVNPGLTYDESLFVQLD
jgi:ectoine hydroxylase-related dioxygenase (phytanoyl-CoA dioxygenase family)